MLLISFILSVLLIIVTYKITKNKQAQINIIQLFDLIKEEAAIINPEKLTFTYLNKTLSGNLQYNQSELIGQRINKVCSNCTQEQIKKFIKPLINKTIDVLTAEIIVERQDGSSYSTTVILKYFNDINILIAIGKNSIKTEDANKQDVSAAHFELRTALTTISGALKIILSGVVGEVPITMLEMLNVANKSSTKLLEQLDGTSSAENNIE